MVAYMKEHAQVVDRYCESCKKHENVLLTHFWATDNVFFLAPSLVGSGHYWPFKKGAHKKRILLIAINYFTKWIEVWALTINTLQEVHRIIWEDIMYRFGLPYTIILIMPNKSMPKTSQYFLHLIGSNITSLCHITHMAMGRQRQQTRLF